jgi:hypothetical protein
MERRAENKKLEMALDGEKVAGVEAALKAPLSQKATSDVPLRARIRRVAAKDKERRLAWLVVSRAWLWSYQAALVKRKNGEREVEFPAGTLLMHHHHKAKGSGTRGLSGPFCNFASSFFGRFAVFAGGGANLLGDIQINVTVECIALGFWGSRAIVYP